MNRVFVHNLIPVSSPSVFIEVSFKGGSTVLEFYFLDIMDPFLKIWDIVHECGLRRVTLGVDYGRQWG
jgi:hypothetical protein